MLQFFTRFSLVIKCYFLCLFFSSINVAAQYFQPAKDLSTYTAIPLQAYPVTLGIGDFNGDGKLDLVTVNYESDNTILNNRTVAILLNTGLGQFSPPAFYLVNGEVKSVLVTDFNNDAKLDLAVLGGSGGAIMVLLGNGDGTFQTATD